MSDVAVTRINDQNFQVLSCPQVNDTKSKTPAVDEKAIDIMLRPIHSEYESSLIKSAKQQVKKIVLQAFKEEDQISLFDLEDIKEYKIGIHKLGTIAFAFLLRPLSSAELDKIEKESSGKTYLTGDPADLLIKEEDFKH